jgi:hypothetical protein
MQQEFQTKLQEQETRCLTQQQEFQTKLQEQETRCLTQQQEFQTKLQEQEMRFGEKCSTQKQEFQTKLQEQEMRFGEKEEMLQGKISAQEQEQERRLGELERRFEEMMKGLEREFGEKLKTQEVKVQELCEDNEGLKRRCGIWKFTMENFSKEKAKDTVWKSPPMYTHPCGYKFCIGIDANGYEESHGKSVHVYLWMMPGKYDGQLVWPATVKFTLELINHFENGENEMCTETHTWDKPTLNKIRYLTRVPGKSRDFISHSELARNHATRTHFLKDDTLHFVLKSYIYI